MRVFPMFLSALTTEDKFALSGEMLLKGMGTVFMVLILLWAILAVFGMVFGTKQAKPAPKQKTAPKQSPAPVKTAPVADNGAIGNGAAGDGELIAAITAAIEAYRASEGAGALPFRVVSFKRKNGASGWNGNASDN